MIEKIDDVSEIDYTLLSAPVFTSNYVETNHKVHHDIRRLPCTQLLHSLLVAVVLVYIVHVQGSGGGGISSLLMSMIVIKFILCLCILVDDRESSMPSLSRKKLHSLPLLCQLLMTQAK